MNQIREKKTNSYECIVPEKLRLWDECDWSVVPDSLLPFEYGPSSEETAEGCGGAVVIGSGNTAAEG